jgi:hypothetical protein
MQFNAQSIEADASRLLNEKILAQIGVEPLDIAKYPGDIDEAISLASLASTGVWFNNSTGDGLVLHYSVNDYFIPALKKDGSEFEVKFADMSTILNTAVLGTNASLDIYNNPISETYLIKIKGKIGTFRVKAKDLSAIPETQIGTNVTITEDIDPEKDYKKKSKSALERDFKPRGYERKLAQEEPVEKGLLEIEAPEEEAPVIEEPIEKSESELRKQKAKEMFDTVPLEILAATSIENRKVLNAYRKAFVRELKKDPTFFMSFDDWLKEQ